MLTFARTRHRQQVHMPGFSPLPYRRVHHFVFAMALLVLEIAPPTARALSCRDLTRGLILYVHGRVALKKSQSPQVRAAVAQQISWRSGSALVRASVMQACMVGCKLPNRRSSRRSTWRENTKPAVTKSRRPICSTLSVQSSVGVSRNAAYWGLYDRQVQKL